LIDDSIAGRGLGGAGCRGESDRRSSAGRLEEGGVKARSRVAAGSRTVILAPKWALLFGPEVGIEELKFYEDLLIRIDFHLIRKTVIGIIILRGF
jgi:hypothetical protein